MHTMGKKKDRTFPELTHHGHNKYILVMLCYDDHHDFRENRDNSWVVRILFT